MFCWELLHHCIRSAFKNLFQTFSSRADESVEAKFSEHAQKKFTPVLLQCLHDRNVSLCYNRLCDGWVSTMACNATIPLSAAALCGDCARWSPRSLELTRSRRSSCVSLPADQSAPAAHQCHAQTMKSASETASPSSWVAFCWNSHALRFIKNYHYFSVAWHSKNPVCSSWQDRKWAWHGTASPVAFRDLLSICCITLQWQVVTVCRE